MSPNKKPHCISAPSGPISVARGAASVHMVPAATDNISWLIEYDAQGDAQGDAQDDAQGAAGLVALVDGPSMTPVLAYCETHKLKITHILNTHTHGDHIGVNHGLERAQRDAPHLFSERVEVWGGARVASDIPHLTRALNDGDDLELGRLRGRAWLTEGHLNGHISLFFWALGSPNTTEPLSGDEVALFSGDTMFAAGCGRLFDGPAEAMYESLTRLCALPEDTLVFPAHEYTLDNLRFARYARPESAEIVERLEWCERERALGRATLPSTIAHERATNPFVLAEDTARFAELRALKDRGAHRAL